MMLGSLISLLLTPWVIVPLSADEPAQKKPLSHLYFHARDCSYANKKLHLQSTVECQLEGFGSLQTDSLQVEEEKMIAEGNVCLTLEASQRKIRGERALFFPGEKKCSFFQGEQKVEVQLMDDVPSHKELYLLCNVLHLQQQGAEKLLIEAKGDVHVSIRGEIAAFCDELYLQSDGRTKLFSLTSQPSSFVVIETIDQLKRLSCQRLDYDSFKDEVHISKVDGEIRGEELFHFSSHMLTLFLTKKVALAQGEVIMMKNILSPSTPLSFAAMAGSRETAFFRSDFAELVWREEDEHWLPTSLCTRGWNEGRIHLASSFDEGKVSCQGTTRWDFLNHHLSVERDPLIAHNFVFLKAPLGSCRCQKVELDWSENEGKSRLDELHCQGELFFQAKGSTTVDCCGIAEEAFYREKERLLELKAKRGERVLFWDRGRSIELSADGLRMQKVGKNPSPRVEGIGTTRFRLGEKEWELLIAPLIEDSNLKQGLIRKRA